MMAIESRPANDENFDRNAFWKIVDELVEVLNGDVGACDLKWTLFVAAAQSYRYESQLKPVPPAYQNGPIINIDALLDVIERTPSFRVLQRLLADRNETILLEYRKVIELLHWNLVINADPNLKTVDRSKVSVFSYSSAPLALSH